MPELISIRIGSQHKTSIDRRHPLVAHLAARGDNLAGIIKRDLARYYALLDNYRMPFAHPEDVIDWLRDLPRIAEDQRVDWIVQPEQTNCRDHWDLAGLAYATLDALERAHILTTQGLSVDDALTTVGLVVLTDSANSNAVNPDAG